MSYWILTIRAWRAAQVFLALLVMGPLVSSVAADETFVELFAAGSLSGWVEEQHEFFKAKHPHANTWSVKDGVVHCDGSLGNCGFLRYDRKLCDFVLRLEFRMAGKCNSGVGIRAAVPYTTLKPNTLPSNVGLEFQIADDPQEPISKQSSGAFYGRHPPLNRAILPGGEWNELELECRGSKIRATLNGHLVQDVDTSAVEALRDRPPCGYLSLQNHGHDIDFRRVRLKVIESRY